MTQTTLRPALAYLDAARNVPTLAGFAITAAVLLTKWSIRQRTRTALYHLSDDQLRDIGVSLDQAKTEAQRHFWQG
ncbi:DUF1127 domain-containing protein [uncultured Pelagimonas sp.]|uniref:DUF1127 domain-containing protein n=1 Tax=uncultured Pelagimonas sp. TaxID=1618102 RepID=UPI002611E5FF|nr:DUF1127 domain-containing protein [uncultured Pelagimonas sp.]